MSKSILGVLIASLLISLEGSAVAQPVGWAHRSAIQVTERSGQALAGYQVPLTIDTATPIAAGQMKADGSDIRFYADCTYSTELPYWIESGIGTATTRIWVRVDALPANAATALYMVYGNAAATAVSNLFTTFDGEGGGPSAPLSSTHRVFLGNPSAAGACQRGFRFVPNTDLLVLQVGKNAPTATARWVTIFDNESQAILAQTQVSGPVAEYTYANLGSPLWLTKGKEYLLELFTEDGETYYFGAAPQVDSNITYLDMRYCNGCTKDTFPTNSLQSIHYGYPDFMFVTRKVASVEPQQVGLGCIDTPTCNADCSPSSCGDGKPNAAAGEECDDGNAVDTDACTSFCKNASCGDGIVRAGVEECDDGNRVDGDACTNACTVAVCGDGIVRDGVEACDDGNRVDGDACTNACTVAVCGDGVVRDGIEACDDGNDVDTDACRNHCALPTCGDGVVQVGVEACDDGNDVDTDACRNNCMPAICGDSVVHDGVEACDDGNGVDGDTCTNACTPARCGDGVVHIGVEACDDGNDVETDACRHDCTSARCGDGIVQIGVEECEDGNQVDTDGCRNDCRFARCGDGVVHNGVEQCDDGNTKSGDGCSADCRFEAPSADAGASSDTDGGLIGPGDASFDSTVPSAVPDDACSCRAVGRGASSSTASGALGTLVVGLCLRRRRRG